MAGDAVAFAWRASLSVVRARSDTSDLARGDFGIVRSARAQHELT